jgi:cell division protein FtsL
VLKKLWWNESEIKLCLVIAGILMAVIIASDYHNQNYLVTQQTRGIGRRSAEEGKFSRYKLEILVAIKN